MTNNRKPRLPERGTTRTQGSVLAYPDCTPIALQGQPIHRADGQVIGMIENDTFKKLVRASKHMLRVPPSWAIDKVIFDQLQHQGINWLEILDTESGTKYRASLDTFKREAFPLERGFGCQLALPLEMWQVIRPGDIDGRQLGLWA